MADGARGAQPVPDAAALVREAVAGAVHERAPRRTVAAVAAAAIAAVLGRRGPQATMPLATVVPPRGPTPVGMKVNETLGEMAKKVRTPAAAVALAARRAARRRRKRQEKRGDSDTRRAALDGAEADRDKEKGKDVEMGVVVDSDIAADSRAVQECGGRGGGGASEGGLGRQMVGALAVVPTDELRSMLLALGRPADGTREEILVRAAAVLGPLGDGLAALS